MPCDAAGAADVEGAAGAAEVDGVAGPGVGRAGAERSAGAGPGRPGVGRPPRAGDGPGVGRPGADGLAPRARGGAGVAPAPADLPASSAGKLSRILRTTGGSIVELAERTNSPWFFRWLSRVLLSIPSSFASS